MDGFGVKNGGELTASEAMHFDHQLKHANLLYLGCKVLVLLDLAYQSRFWTQFELWLSMQEGTGEGLKPATEEHAKRVHLEPIHSATEVQVDSACDLWRTKTPEEAHKLLGKPDVQVTNQSDKRIHLEKSLTYMKTCVYRGQNMTVTAMEKAPDLVVESFDDARGA